ncbi:heavy-metal-associated domain-containing protein [Urechidicola sp. KH5]
MKLVQITFFISVVLLSVSCSKTTNNQSNENSVQSKNSEINTSNNVAKSVNIEVAIEGMTCEIGCAKLIESKTYKLPGLTFADVSFEEGIGRFTFNNDQISTSEIEAHINGIAGGELYKVTTIKEVATFEEEVTD